MITKGEKMERRKNSQSKSKKYYKQAFFNAVTSRNFFQSQINEIDRKFRFLAKITFPVQYVKRLCFYAHYGKYEAFENNSKNHNLSFGGERLMIVLMWYFVSIKL